MTKKSPSQSKEVGASINFFPPIRLDIRLDGGRTLNYRIEQLPEFQITGNVCQYLLDHHLFHHTGHQWEIFFNDAKMRKLADSSAVNPNFFGVNRAPYFGVGNPISPEPGHLWYFTGFVLQKGFSGDDEVITIPSQTYAVFTSEPYDYRVTENVTSAFYRLQQEIFRAWLPSTEYTKVDGPELETYVSIEKQACLEIWMPVSRPQ